MWAAKEIRSVPAAGSCRIPRILRWYWQSQGGYVVETVWATMGVSPLSEIIAHAANEPIDMLQIGKG